MAIGVWTVKRFIVLASVGSNAEGYPFIMQEYAVIGTDDELKDFILRARRLWLDDGWHFAKMVVTEFTLAELQELMESGTTRPK